MIFLLGQSQLTDGASSASGAVVDELMSGLRPLKPAVEVLVHDEASGSGLWIWLVVLLICVFSGLLWFWLSRRKGEDVSAEDRAMASLGVISEQGFSDGDFVMEVSGVIKGYLEVKGESAAMHQTTEEFMDDLRDGGLFQGHGVALKRFFVLCDMVKFAGNELADDEREELVDLAGGLVKEISQDFLNKETKV